MKDFTLWTEDSSIPQYHARCTTCEAIITTGIVSISSHWNKCTGKGYLATLLKAREEKKAPLTGEDVEKINKSFFRN